MWVLIKMLVQGRLRDQGKIICEDNVIPDLDLLEILAKRYPMTAIMYADKERSTPSNKVDLTHETIKKIAFQVSQNMRK